MSANSTKSSLTAAVFGTIQFIILVLACVVALPFVVAFVLAGFVWKVIDEL